MHSKFDQAINFFENGNLNESKKLCLEILKDEPKNFDILHLLGIISFQLKNYKKSSELISEAIKINPKDAEAYNNMGIVSKKLNQFDIAYNNFCNAIKLKPDYAEAHNSCGVILKELKKEENDRKFLIPTAEVILTNIVRESFIQKEILPLRFVASTACFRKEAGSYGKDTNGMIRQHQFYKVELVSIVDPNECLIELERMTDCATKVLDSL